MPYGGRVGVSAEENNPAQPCNSCLYKPGPSNVKVLAALFNDDVGNESCRQRQKRKLAS